MVYIINRKGALNWSRKVERQLRYQSSDTSYEAVNWNPRTDFIFQKWFMWISLLHIEYRP